MPGSELRSRRGVGFSHALLWSLGSDRPPSTSGPASRGSQGRTGARGVSSALGAAPGTRRLRLCAAARWPVLAEDGSERGNSVNGSVMSPRRSRAQRTVGPRPGPALGAGLLWGGGWAPWLGGPEAGLPHAGSLESTPAVWPRPGGQHAQQWPATHTTVCKAPSRAQTAATHTLSNTTPDTQQ